MADMTIDYRVYREDLKSYLMNRKMILQASLNLAEKNGPKSLQIEIQGRLNEIELLRILMEKEIL